jgi:hypothetical protein
MIGDATGVVDHSDAVDDVGVGGAWDDTDGQRAVEAFPQCGLGWDDRFDHRWSPVIHGRV